MHKIKRILLLIPLLLFMLFTNGCEKHLKVSSIKVVEKESLSYFINGFSYDNYDLEITYENGSIETIPLDESMISSYDQLSFYKVGTHTINVTYKKATTSFDIVVDKNSFPENIKFESQSVTYDGKPHAIEVTGDLPDGTKVIYKQGNEFTNAGIYDLEVSLICDGYYKKTLYATLTINRANYDLSKLKLEDVEAVYDGFSKNVVLSGEVPAGLSVSYEIENENHEVGNGNNAIDAGVYTVTAKFSNTNSNYNSVKPLSATLTIKQKEYDLTYVTLENKQVTYNGEEHKIEIGYTSITQSLPKDVQYDYYYDGEKTTEGKVNAGVYNVEVRFTSLNPNYIVTKKLNATLTINKEVIDISGIKFNGNQFVYEENTKYSIEYDYKTLPQFVRFVGYSSSESDDIVPLVEFENVKKYMVYAHFTCDNENFVLSNKGIVEASLEIVRKEIFLENIIFSDTYFTTADLSQKITFKVRSSETGEYTEEGPIPDFIKFEYSENNDEIKPAGTYIITLRFYSESNNYVIINSNFEAHAIIQEVQE